MGELQRTVDSLARSIDRPVAVHDRAGRILAYSSHVGPVDEVRAESILTRRTSPRAMEWSRSHGIETAIGPIRVPANPGVGMTARICAPVRYEGSLLGFLWLVDTDEALGDDALGIVESAADAVALAMHREQLMEELERGRERELLRDVLSEHGEQRIQAADELIDHGFRPADAVVALVVRPVRGRSGMTRQDASLRAAIEPALGKARQMTPPRQALELVRHDHGLVLLAVPGPEPTARAKVEEVAHGLHQAMTAGLKTAGLDAAEWRAVVGVGDLEADLADAHISYRRARQAAEVAGLLESYGPVVGWWQLGVYQTLLELPLSHITESSLHPGLVRLVEARDADLWLATLETYFDLGCDARAAARSLGIQRGSLYHRLHRVEELAGVDLRKGDDRLAVHLGIKLARLVGLLDSRAHH